MHTAPSTFDDLGLRDELLAALTELGYEEPTPIQREAIPTMLAGRDLLGQAATGTGKTAAFALPVLHKLADTRDGAAGDSPVALVLVPTRELAMQVCEAMYRYGRRLGARVVPVYGGQPIYRQIRALERGVDIVVATPGRALDHISRGSIRLDGIRQVVLDEADEMLDMGFAEDIEEILSSTPADRQTVLFSATMPPRIASIARTHQHDPVTVRISREAADESAGEVTHTAYVVARPHKAAALGRILDVEAPGAAIVFCRTRTEVDQLTETLNGRGYRAEALHGGMDQEQRDRVMGRMRSATAELLIATDVAARGLDLDHLTHVVNFDVPSSPDVYVHRVGRVGRAGRSGTAITLAEPREQRQLDNIGRITKMPVTIGKIPTVAELRDRQHAITAGALRDALTAGDDESFALLVDELGGEFELADIARAAIALYHRAAGNVDDEQEIPAPYVRPERGRSDRDATDRRPRYADRDAGGEGRGHRPGGRGGEPGTFEPARIFINVGRDANISPGDIVGAIANETSLSGRQIGPIKIAQKFSTVGVPPEAVHEVIDALHRTVVRGRNVKARPYVEQSDERPRRGVGPAAARTGGPAYPANRAAARPGKGAKFGRDARSGGPADRARGDRPAGGRFGWEDRAGSSGRARREPRG